MNPSDLLVPCIIGAILIVGLGLLFSSIRIVPQFQRLVVFRFGNCIGQKGPGLVLLYPFGIDRAISVDLREEVRAIRNQLDEFEKASRNFAGFAKEIDHLLGRIKAIEKHLGLHSSIAA